MFRRIYIINRNITNKALERIINQKLRRNPAVYIPPTPIPTGLFSMYFPGNGYARANNTLAFDVDINNGYTISYWLKPSGLSSGDLTQYVINRASVSNIQFAGGYSRITAAPRFNFNTSTAATNTNNAYDVVEQTWVHHCVTASGGIQKFYINGILVSGWTTAASGTHVDHNYYTVLGDNYGTNGANSLKGLVSHLAHWNRTLSYQEIYELSHVGMDYRTTGTYYSPNSLSGYYIDYTEDNVINDIIDSSRYFIASGDMTRSTDMPTHPGLLSIDITSPNSLDLIFPGVQTDIIWDSIGITEPIMIWLYYSGIVQSLIASGVSSATEYYAWTPSTALADSTAYTIVITSIANTHPVSSDNLLIAPTTSGIDGIFTVYATPGLVHMYINAPGALVADKFHVFRSIDAVNWTEMINPTQEGTRIGMYYGSSSNKTLYSGYSSNTTYIVDHDFDHETDYYYKLAYEPPNSAQVVTTGIVHIITPNAINDPFAGEPTFPIIGYRQSGMYYNISGIRNTLRNTTPTDNKFAFLGTLNQSHESTRRGYNSTLSGTYHNYMDYDSTRWFSTWSGLSQSDFASLVASIASVVNTGMYIHYLTNDMICKNRAVSAFNAFVSGVTYHSGQYNLTYNLRENYLSMLLSDGYDNLYGYLTQGQRDTFASLSYKLNYAFKNGYQDDSNGFDLARLGDTHSNEDTGVALRALAVLLRGTLSDSTLRNNAQTLFNTLYSGYITYIAELSREYLSDGSGGSTPYGGEYEFNEPGRIALTIHTLRNAGYANLFAYSGWINRAKYLAFMIYPNGRTVTTGDGGYLEAYPGNFVSIMHEGSDTDIARERALHAYRNIDNDNLSYGFPNKTVGVYSIPTGVLGDPNTYGLDWYGKNKGMLISRSSWNDDAVILQVFSPRHQHYDKYSQDAGCFTIYYKGFQIPRSGIYKTGDGDIHDNDYRKRTYAGNTITIYQSGELFVDSTTNPGVLTGASKSNNGDQPFRRAINSLSDYNMIDRRQGNTLYHSINSGLYNISYIKCDLTPAYWSWTDASNYQQLFPKKAIDVTREVLFIKPSGILIIDRVITPSGQYTQKNIVHFEKEPWVTATNTETLVAKVGISGTIERYSYAASGYTDVYESGYINIKTLESTEPIYMTKIGGIGYEFWDTASGINRTPLEYSESINWGSAGTGTYGQLYHMEGYGSGKWRLEWSPSGIVTTGLYSWLFIPQTSGLSVSVNTTRPNNQYSNVRTFRYNDLIINTSAVAFSGIYYSTYSGIGISGHLFLHLYPRTNYQFYVKSQDGSSLYQTISFTSVDMDYSYRDLDEERYDMVSSGYSMLIPTGLNSDTTYLYVLSGLNTSARNETSLPITYQSGLQLWLESDNLNYSYNSNITGWIDKSINAYGVSGLSNRAFPIMKNMMRLGNYHASAHFGGHTWVVSPASRVPNASGYLELANNNNIKFTTGKGFTAFVVYYPQITNSVHRQRLLDKGVWSSAGQREYMIEVKDGVLQAFVRSSAGFSQNHTLANLSSLLTGDKIQLATLHIPNNVYEAQVKLYNNGYLLATSGLQGVLNTGGTTALSIGNTPDGTTGFVGDMYAIMIYNSGLTNPQISGVWSYLATKYNIEMSGYLS